MTLTVYFLFFQAQTWSHTPSADNVELIHAAFFVPISQGLLFFDINSLSISERVGDVPMDAAYNHIIHQNEVKMYTQKHKCHNYHACTKAFIIHS